MKITDVMSQPAITVPASASIVTAATTMRDQCVGFLIVTDEDGLAGVVTDRDIVVRFVSIGGRASNVRVADVMSRNVLKCCWMQTIEDAAAMMGDHQVRRLPVFDDAGALIGVLSLDNIARDYSEILAGETLGEIVEERTLPSLVGSES